LSRLKGEDLREYGILRFRPSMGKGMTDNSNLIRQARDLAKQRGHKIGEFLVARIETGYSPIASKECMVGICEYCGATAAVDTSPPPGGAAIWGEALERDCPGEVFI
jgi:hypothetical protein